MINKRRKFVFLLFAVSLLTGGFSVATIFNHLNEFAPTEGAGAKGAHTHKGYHYLENTATQMKTGNAEYWVCCSCHQKYTSNPGGSFTNISDGTAVSGGIDGDFVYYYISVDNRSGTGGVSGTGKVLVNRTMPNLSSVPTRTGYTLREYNTRSNGSGVKLYNADGTGYSSNHYELSYGNTVYAIWDANPLTFNDTTHSLTFSGSSQTTTYTAASNGTGSYTYTLNSQKDKNNNNVSYFSISGTTITVAANTPVSGSSYKLSITATDNNSGASKTATKTVSINKANSSVVTAPSAKSLSYTGSSQTLINTGTASGGTMQYKLSGGSYSTSAPSATNAGTYTVYYKVVGDGNHNDTSEQNLSVTIAKVDSYYSTTPSSTSPTYNGSAQNLCNGGVAVGGTIYYKISGGEYSTSIPTATDAGTYTVYYKIVGDSNHNDKAEASFNTTIAKASSSALTVSGRTLTWNNNAQALITTSGTASGGTMQYKIGSGGTYSSSIPTASATGTYTIYYYLKGDSNHTDTAENSVTTYINNATVTVSIDSGSTNYGTLSGTTSWPINSSLTLEPYGNLLRINSVTQTTAKANGADSNYRYEFANWRYNGNNMTSPVTFTGDATIYVVFNRLSNQTDLGGQWYNLTGVWASGISHMIMDGSSNFTLTYKFRSLLDEASTYNSRTWAMDIKKYTDETTYYYTIRGDWACWGSGSNKWNPTLTNETVGLWNSGAKYTREGMNNMDVTLVHTWNASTHIMTSTATMHSNISPYSSQDVSFTVTSNNLNWNGGIVFYLGANDSYIRFDSIKVTQGSVAEPHYFVSDYNSKKVGSAPTAFYLAHTYAQTNTFTNMYGISVPNGASYTVTGNFKATVTNDWGNCIFIHVCAEGYPFKTNNGDTLGATFRGDWCGWGQKIDTVRNDSGPLDQWPSIKADCNFTLNVSFNSTTNICTIVAQMTRTPYGTIQYTCTTKAITNYKSEYNNRWLIIGNAYGTCTLTINSVTMANGNYITSRGYQGIVDGGTI